jgi:hypothetical protein
MLRTISLPTMLMIGGSGRNVGKTTLICAIIRKFASSFPIIGLKVTSIRTGESDSHGNHESPLSEEFKITEESGTEGRKDTARMLEAGAKKVYFIQSTDYNLPFALNSFFKLVDRDSIIICETRSLRRLIIPGVFILINDPSRNNPKSDFTEFIDTADLLIQFDPANPCMESQTDKICITGGRWQLIVQ